MLTGYHIQYSVLGLFSWFTAIVCDLSCMLVAWQFHNQSHVYAQDIQLFLLVATCTCKFIVCHFGFSRACNSVLCVQTIYMYHLAGL